MALQSPSRGLTPRCLFCSAANIPLRPRSQQQRAFSRALIRKAKNADDTPKRSNPVLEEFQRKNPDIVARQQNPQAQQQQMPSPGDLSTSSIFEDDRRAQEAIEVDEKEEIPDDKVTVGGNTRNPRNMLRVLDPDPNSREQYERKKVIQMVRRGGRVTQKQFLKRTERDHLAKSPNLKTSVKKLGNLARQISGKTLDDAITQMRFSKKKVATDVLKQLEFARDEAIVMRGMGLGPSSLSDQSSGELEDTPSPSPSAPIEIQLKSGARHTVTSRHNIYIDQAWVGRGPYGKLPDFRAKGRINIMRTPWTSLSVLLKEEGTRVREYEEREAKRRKARLGKVWVPLPDRPVVGRMAWYSW